MWTGLFFRDASDDILRRGYYETYKHFQSYTWVFSDKHGSGAYLELTSRRMLWDPLFGYVPYEGHT